MFAASHLLEKLPKVFWGLKLKIYRSRYLYDEQRSHSPLLIVTHYKILSAQSRTIFLFFVH